MLGKLLKHELKATVRYFAPLFLAVLILTPITRLVTSLDVFDGYLAIIPGFFTILYVISIIAITLVTTVVIIMRFYKNLICDEGYLMHTLPVTATQHILSKTITSFIWNIASILITCLSLFGFFYTPERFSLIKSGLDTGWMMFNAELGGVGKPFIILTVIVTIIGLVSNCLYFFVSIALGQVLSRHKIIGSFAAALVINMVTQLVTSIVIVPFTLLLGSDTQDPMLLTQVIYPVTIVLTIIFSVLYFLGTKYILEKKLNLE